MGLSDQSQAGQGFKVPLAHMDLFGLWSDGIFCEQ